MDYPEFSIYPVYINFHTNWRNVNLKISKITKYLNDSPFEENWRRETDARFPPFAGSPSSPFRDTKVVLETKSIVSSTRESVPPTTLPSLERPWTLDPTIKPASVLKLLEQDANHGSRTPLGAIFVPRFVYRNSRTFLFDPPIPDFYALRSHFACLLNGGERHLAINMDSGTAHTFCASARSHVNMHIMRALFVLYISLKNGIWNRYQAWRLN